jgi:hypothetical protein
MAISEGLFKGQDQSEADLLAPRDWDQETAPKPSFLEGAGLAPITGAAAGIANSISVLARGLRVDQSQEVPDANAAAAGATRDEGPQHQPWMDDWNAKLDDIQAQAHAGAKSMAPDPLTTGTGANLVHGFTKAITEFSIGSLAGPQSGAAVLGLSEGYSRYLDLREQGVDDETAARSAWLTGVANGAGALMPMSLPAKLFESVPLSGTLLAQAGAGAVINTAFGTASQVGDAAILRKAGYPAMADQLQPWDAAQLWTNALTGAFFGVHQGMIGGIRIDPSVRDAAKVIQDRQEIIDRAVGVPVDMKSMAVHQQAMTTALGDLMAGKPVDLGGVDMEGAGFARPEQDSVWAANVIRDEFEKAGVMEHAEAFDDFLNDKIPPEPKPAETVGQDTGELLTPESVGARITDAQERLQEAGPEPAPEDRAAMVEAEKARLVTPESVRARLEEAHGEELPKVVEERAQQNVSEAAGDEVRKTAQGDLERAQKDQEQLARSADPAAAALADRPDMTIPAEGKEVKASDALEEAKATADQVDREADIAFTTAVNCEARHA